MASSNAAAVVVLGDSITDGHGATTKGPNALTRFDRDVLAQAGVRYLIVLEGVNDLGALARTGEVSAAEHGALVGRIEERARAARPTVRQ
jgi:hypothetical protein